MPRSHECVSADDLRVLGSGNSFRFSVWGLGFRVYGLGLMGAWCPLVFCQPPERLLDPNAVYSLLILATLQAQRDPTFLESALNPKA